MNVVCPKCKKTITWSKENPYRPFCSERCKLIDLGAWADGSYTIPDDELVDPDQIIDQNDQPD